MSWCHSGTKAHKTQLNYFWGLQEILKPLLEVYPVHNRDLLIMILTRFIRHTTKSRIKKTIVENIQDVENAYLILSKPHLQPKAEGRLYHITINHTKTNNAKELNFKLTNNLFRRIHRQLKQTHYYLNYLFVLEYPYRVSIGMKNIKDTNLHAHITLNTNLPHHLLEKAFKVLLREDLHFYIEDITFRLDIEDLSGYITKQSRLNDFLTHDHYNYKIDYRSPNQRKTTSSDFRDINLQGSAT
jgi:hypothetical protein